MKKVRVGSGSGFWGDMIDPAVEVVEKGDVGYIAFDHLAELTLSILQRQRANDPGKGYIEDVVPICKAILPTCVKKGIRIITNAGGANPEAAADRVLAIAREFELKGVKVAVVLGDDVKDRLEPCRAKGWKFRNLDTDAEDIDSIRDRIVAANVYLGAEPIVEALKKGAQVIVTGRNTDSSSYIAPLIYEFGWAMDDWNRLAAGITVGHLLECSCASTGGISNLWKDVPEPWRIGFPIAEVSENGEAIITKVPGSGGLVNKVTCTEHLVYEIQDLANYIMPEVITDLTRLELEQVGIDRVKVTGAIGKPKPPTLKCGIGYRDGFIGEAHMMFSWPEALSKARWAARFVSERLKMAKLDAQEIKTDFIGFNALHGPLVPEPAPGNEPNEIMLRMAVRAKSKAEAGKVRREMAALAIVGAMGMAFGGSPPPVREVISLWSTLIPREEVPTRVLMKEV